jgi:hypothetical protein
MRTLSTATHLRSRSVVAALVALTLGSFAAVAAPAASAASTSVTLDQRVLTNHVLAPGQSVVIPLDSLPANATSASFAIGAAPGSGATSLAMCPGGSVTTSCTSTTTLAVPSAGDTVYAHTTLDMTGAGRKAVIYNSKATTDVTVRLASYTAEQPAAAPSTSGRPGPGNTGVPSGTRLSVHEGDLTITTPNTVVDAKEIRGIVWVRAANVTIKRSLITGRHTSTDLALIMVQGEGSSVRVEDTEMYAKSQNAHIRGIIGSNFTLTRVNMHHVIDQMVITGSNVLVQDSWLHSNLHYAKDPNYNNTPSHDDNAQISIGNNIKFLRNTLAGTHNAAIQVTQDRGAVSNVVFSDNHVSNGGCSMNLAQKAHGPMKGFIVKNNVFTRTQIHKGCAMIVDSGTLPLMSVSNNKWDDGAAVKVTTR